MQSARPALTSPHRPPQGSAARRPWSGRGLLIGAVAIVGLVAVRVFTDSSIDSTLPDRLQDLLTLGISVVIESVPFVVLGIVLSAVVQVWVPDGFILRILPKRAVPRRVVISFIGMLLPVCECGNVPLARGLQLRGFTAAESITFLLAAPILNPITIVTTYQAFGWDNGILVARIVGGFVIANLLGWLFSRHPRPEALLSTRFAAQCRVPEGHGHEHGKVEQTVRVFFREASSMMPALFIGAALAGLIQVAVPRDVLVALGSNPLLSIAAMMALAFVLSICSNVDAFFALSLASTFMPGAIVAFLVFGPIVDLKMIALMRTTYSGATIGIIAAVTALVSVALGLLVNNAIA